jgi:hypothetical protein
MASLLTATLPTLQTACWAGPLLLKVAILDKLDENKNGPLFLHLKVFFV